MDDLFFPGGMKNTTWQTTLSVLNRIPEAAVKTTLPGEVGIVIRLDANPQFGDVA